MHGWFGQSINNKPFLALDAENHIFVTDPDGFRVLEFDQMGNFLRGWGEVSSGIDGFGVPSGIAVAGDERVWVSDAENNFTLGFLLPPLAIPVEEGDVEFPSESSLPQIPLWVILIKQRAGWW